MLPFIIACEIGFWVILLLGLALRYVARRPRFGALFLIATPLIDIALLVCTVIDLRNGHTPHWSHSMAAFYLGFSIVFGKSMINFADRTFQRKVLHLSPIKPPTNEWKLFVQAVAATLIAMAITELCILATPSTAFGLRDAYKSGVAILFIWFITGPLWTSLKPSKAAAAR
ncbi:hypothetical protein QVA66_04440 [Staphylococcus chromogenes]|nr:hypothetical protein [Staphylococcus chromogenes]